MLILKYKPSNLHGINVLSFFCVLVLLLLGFPKSHASVLNTLYFECLGARLWSDGHFTHSRNALLVA